MSIVTKTQKLTLTLFVSLFIALTLSASSANALGHTTNARVSARNHQNLKRFVKKRSPFPQDDDGPSLIPLIGVGEDPDDAEASPQSSTTGSSASVTSLPNSVTTTEVATTSSTVSLSSTVTSETSASTSSSSSSSSSSFSESETSETSTEASTTSTTSETESTSAPAQEAETSQSLNIITESPENASITGPTTKTLTSSVSAPSNSVSPEASGATASSSKSTALTAIIAIAASAGGIVIMWTIFRKWKLGRSAKFDQRMQPIDWQPTDAPVPGHRHTGSDTSSFHSGVGHSDLRRYGSTSDGGHGTDRIHGSTLEPLPDHDFTAGPSTVGGYADLNRGPSPQPQMQDLSRGPSMTRPTNYDVGVPLHHQAGYGVSGRY